MSLFHKKSKEREMKSPIDGDVKDITETPDAVFSAKMMGDGFYIQPTASQVYAPCDAVVEMIFPTKHAIGLRLKDNTAILLHFGLDTVQLEGKGFTLHVEQGQKVKEGSLLLEADLEYIRAHATDDGLIMIFTEGMDDKQLRKQYGIYTHHDKIVEIH